jgi:tetratricopeptide (TPR) repeat protein
MDQLKRFIHEVHRRSLWQVLAIYLVGSWGALQAVQGITEAAGLPDWVPPGALILLLLGLPIVLATAFVQEGVGGGADVKASIEPVGDGPDRTAERESAGATRPARDGGARRQLLTWRNAIIGGVGGFTVLALLVGASSFMWARGLGPGGSLLAQGSIDERERVVLADFGNATADSLLGDVVTEALRVDLAESQVLTLMEPAYVGQVLQRMGRRADDGFSPELAREAAVREGIRALIEGEIGAAGTGYVLTARVVAAAEGTVLASFRETARDEQSILGAIDALSQAIRNKAGESLVSIRESEPLAQVTTASLDALRLYTQAFAVENEGDSRRAITLLEEAIALDPQFATAWRRLAILLGNTNAPVERRAEAAARAYELRDRLPPRERDLATANYFMSAGPQQDRARAAQIYENIIDAYPEEVVALNNLGILKWEQNQLDSAMSLFRRAATAPGQTAISHTNYIQRLQRLGREQEAEREVARFAELYPGNPSVASFRFVAAFNGQRWAEADSIARTQPQSGPGAANTYTQLAVIRVARGRLGEAEPHLRQRAAIGVPNAYNTASDEARIQGLLLGDDAAARRALSDVIARHPLESIDAEVRPYLALAEAYARIGDRRETEAYLTRLETERPEATQGAGYQSIRAAIFGHLALANGEHAAAEGHFREARRLQSCASCYQVEMGFALLGAGKPEEASAELSAAAAERPTGLLLSAVYPPLVQEALGEALEAQGRRQDAAAAYDRVVEIWKDADPVLQPRVQRAREKAAALRGTP